MTRVFQIILHSRLPGLAFLLGIVIACSARAQVQQSPPTDEMLNRFAAKLVEQMPHVSNLQAPGADCSKNSSVVKKKKVPAQVKLYSCEEDHPPPALSKQSKRAYASVGFYIDEDNSVMGLIPDGNDLGYTYGSALFYTHSNESGGKWSVDLTSSLYTKLAVPVGDQPDYNAIQKQVAAETGQQVAGGSVISSTDDRDPIQFADVTRLKASFEKGDHFYYRLGLGFEFRKTDPKDFTPAVSAQNWWHKLLGIYQFKDIPAGGQPVKIAVKENTPVTISFPDFVHPGEFIKSEVTGNSAEVTPGFKADEGLQKLSKVSALVSLDGGVKNELWGGRCVLQLEAGGFLSTESQNVIGPNSYVHVSDELKSTLLKRKNGQPRIGASVGTQILYFPKTDAEGEKKFGFVSQAMLESYHQVGTQGNTLNPFIILFIPRGRQSFQNVNDGTVASPAIDPISRIGLRFNFQ